MLKRLLFKYLRFLQFGRFSGTWFEGNPWHMHSRGVALYHAVRWWNNTSIEHSWERCNHAWKEEEKKELQTELNVHSTILGLKAVNWKQLSWMIIKFYLTNSWASLEYLSMRSGLFSSSPMAPPRGNLSLMVWILAGVADSRSVWSRSRNSPARLALR